MEPINIIFHRIISSKAYEFAAQPILRLSGYTFQDLVNEAYALLPTIMQTWDPMKEVTSSLSSWIWLNLGWHFNGLKRQLDPFSCDINNVHFFDNEESFPNQEDLFFSKETDALFEDVFDLKTDFDSLEKRIEEKRSKEERLVDFENRIKSIQKMLSTEEKRVLDALFSATTFVDASQLVGKSPQNFSYHKQKLIEKLRCLFETNSQKFEKNEKEAILLCKKLTRLGWTIPEIAVEVSSSPEIISAYLDIYDSGFFDRTSSRDDAPTM
ncbi:MAG: hypothetical protein RBR08_11970 [Desulforegulaceae bacterium]|nr:hypothetical protein [Desulforegulaceae bacterium]